MTTPYTVKVFGVNLLTAVQASLETGTTGWAAGANTTITNSATQAFYGSKSLRLSSSAAGATSATTPTGTSGVAVSASTGYRAFASFRTGVSARSCTVTINWYKAGGASSSVRASDVSTAVTDSTSGWTTAWLSVISPSDAVYAAIVVTVAANAAASELHYVDQICLQFTVNALNAEISQGPTWVEKGWGSFNFQLPTTDPVAAECIPQSREVQLWYNDGSTDTCKWGGRIARREAQGAQTEIQCLGSEWDLSGIELGPILTNYLTDPDFEDATLAHWTAVGATKSSDTATMRKGTRSMKLVSGSKADNFAYQQFTVDNSAGTIAVAIFVRARFYATASAWTDTALQERGLFVKRIESGVDQTEGAAGQVGRWTAITNDGPFNQWVKIVAPPVSVPAGHTQTVEVRCYSPYGTIYWDTAVAVAEESTGANTASGYADLNTIIGNVLTYAQDTTKNKTDYGIHSPAGSFGLSLSQQWQFYAHGNVWNDVMLRFVNAGTADIWIGWDTAGITKTLNVATARGSDKSGSVTLTLGGNATLSSYSQDGQETAGAITVLLQGSAAEKILTKDYAAVSDVAYSVDTAANGGITRSAIITAPPETTLDGASDEATVELARRKELVTVPTFNTPADALFAAGVLVGDTIKFDGGGYGWVGAAEVAKSRRVVEMTLAPDKNLMSVTGN